MGVRIILNVDDDGANRYAASRALQHAGFEVVECGTGAEAAALAAARKPDLILLDINLPDTNGFEVCRRLKADPATASIPVIHVSAISVSAHDQVRGLDCGADGFITHPSDPEVLVAAARAALRAREQAAKHQSMEMQQVRRESLAEGEGWLRTVLEATPECVKLVGPDGELLFMNSAGLGMIESDDPGRAIGGCVFDLVAEEHRDHWREMHGRVCAGEKLTWEFDVVGLKGTRRCMETHAVPMRTPGGRVAQLAVTRDVTQRRAVETELRESEAKFRQLADAMPQIVWAARPDGTVDYYNRRWFEYTGLPEDGRTGDDGWASVPDEEGVKRVHAAWAESVRTGKRFQTEYRLRKSDGEYRWHLGRAVPVRDGSGTIVRWYGTHTDIHDQKMVETELRHSREQLELVVKGARVGVWYCPLPFDELIWDETVKEHFHLAPDAEVTIDTFYERLHPADRERTRQTIESSIARKVPYDIEYRTVSADGMHVKWVRASGRGFYDAAGDPTRFDGITIDVTERVRAEERIREESQLVETINEIGRSLAAELDLTRLVQTITDATTSLSGAQFGAFFYNVLNERGESYALYTLSGVDRSHFEKFPMPRNTDVFGPTFRGEGVVRLDDVTKDPRYGKNPPYQGMPAGHLPVRSYLAAPVISRSGEVLGGLFFGHADAGVFTERAERLVSGIAAQAAVAIDNARLYEAAKRANAEKDKLLESERAARSEVEKASQMKDEFLATLSHELRTPLNAILGWSQVLRRGTPTPEDVREGTEIIERNARVQTQIIADLLDMSRIISGKIRLDVQPVDLADVVRASMETVRPAADAKGVRLRAVLDPFAGPVSGDPSRLQQVFWNLLTNAVKFTARNGQVQVVLERVNSHLEISVIDTGEGITPEFLPFVFDRFRQGDASTTRKHGGLGLGLAIVKQLVELHGGTVRVKSGGRGQGSTFIVALPLPVVHPPQETPEGRRHPSGGDPPRVDSLCVQIEGVKVLVVDDEPDSRNLVKRVLDECKAVVTTAASAQEAFERLQSERPDVLVSDVGMPVEDGYSLIRRVRALGRERGGDTPAVALTAYARSDDRLKALLAGFQHHVVKPAEPAELVAVVATLAGRVPANRLQ